MRTALPKLLWVLMLLCAVARTGSAQEPAQAGASVQPPVHAANQLPVPPSSQPAAEASAQTPPPNAPPAELQSWAMRQSGLCAEAVAAAERKWEIPSGLLLTMAKVESGRPLPPTGRLGPWPWTIDADGQGGFYDTKAAAMDGVRNALARGARYVDVGCVQINLQHHPSAFRNLDEAFDPALNADYAGRFLRGLRDGPAGGNWYQAVGFYHSQTPDRAALYRERVSAVAEGRAMPMGGAEAPLFQRAIQRGSIRLQLAGGGMLIVFRRQPSTRPQRHSPCEIARVLGDFLSSAPRGCRR